MLASQKKIGMLSRTFQEQIQETYLEVETLKKYIENFQKKNSKLLRPLHPEFSQSGSNFLHYLGLRQMNLKSLQLNLVRFGLSSLGRCESYVLHNVEQVLERIAELQEEILWLCEAAHVPVIWATQVLEGAAKSGLPSRAEVTDAAASVRAECVMLNKGPFIEFAVRTLSDILQRMEFHTYKKRNLYRKLSVAKLK